MVIRHSIRVISEKHGYAAYEMHSSISIYLEVMVLFSFKNISKKGHFFILCSYFMLYNLNLKSVFG